MDDIEKDRPTGEVGSEGGSTGDVEIDRGTGPGTGSEATETWRPRPGRVEEIRRNESGTSRRSPPTKE